MILGYVILLHAKLFVVFYRVIAIDGVFFVYIVGLFTSFYCYQYNYILDFDPRFKNVDIFLF